MNVPLERRMTVQEFLDWAEAQPKGRYELVDGQAFAMPPERARHVRTKVAVAIALRDAIGRDKPPCEAFGDGMTVVIDQDNAREPDALVQGGRPIDPDSLVADSPMIVVEVLAPSSERSDTGEKLSDYFSVASIRHYLIVNPFRRLMIHHERSEAGAIETRVLEQGEIGLFPPGITVPLAAIFGAPDS